MPGETQKASCYLDIETQVSLALYTERPSKNYQDNLQELRDRIEKLESEKINQNTGMTNN